MELIGSGAHRAIASIDWAHSDVPHSMVSPVLPLSISQWLLKSVLLLSSHYTDEETEDGWDEVTCPKLHRQEGTEPRSKAWAVPLQFCMDTYVNASLGKVASLQIWKKTLMEERWLADRANSHVGGEHLCSLPNISISALPVTRALVVGWGHVTSSGQWAVSRSSTCHFHATVFNGQSESFQHSLALPWTLTMFEIVAAPSALGLAQCQQLEPLWDPWYKSSINIK